MAVKEKEVKEKENSKMFSFEDLNKTMSKISILGSTMDKSEISKIDEYLDSGNYHLNAALTGSLFKGYPSNRTVSVCGPSGCLIPTEKINVYVMKTLKFERKIIVTD
jgi:hypothetical protein